MNENMSENTRTLGFLPPLGWNSWNTFTWDINESLIFEIADCMVKDGYKDAGYEYLVIDDCAAFIAILFIGKNLLIGSAVI